MKKLLIIISLILFLIPAIYGIQPTQQYNKIFLNPFYTTAMAVGVNNTYNVTVNPPDGISSVINSIVSFNAQINGQTQTFTLWVNNKSCNPVSYSVATAFSTTGNIQFYFDCSNQITKAGTYKIIVQSAVATGAITGWLDLTYMNNPQSLSMKGTEYNSGDIAKVWLQLLSSDKSAVDNAMCFTDLFNPIGTFLRQGAPMSHLTDGIYMYDFIAPRLTGVYPAVAICYSPTSIISYDATSASLGTGIFLNGTLSNTFSDDDSLYNVQTNNNLIDLNFTISNAPITGQESVVIIDWKGIWSGNTYCNVNQFLWNYNNNTWSYLVNKISDTDRTNEYFGNSINIPIGQNLSSMGYLKNNTMLIRLLSDSCLVNATLKTDEFGSRYMTISSQQWTQVQGSSEIHIGGTGNFYDIKTLCGDMSNSCAKFIHTDINGDQLEGLVEEDITLTNLYGRAISTEYYYTTAESMDCTGLINVTLTKVGVSTDITNLITLNNGDKRNCILDIPIKFDNAGQNININIYFDNLQKWETIWDNDNVEGMTNTIETYCNALGINNNYTYIIPINSTVPFGQLGFCQRALDDLYYFNTYFTATENINTIGTFASYYDELTFYYPIIADHYQVISGQNINSISSKTNLITPSTGRIIVSGTEYSPRDPATIFLQLQDNFGNPVINGNCYLDIFYPLNNGAHPYTIQNAPMISINNSVGIYYYDLTAPSILGVYMLSAKCSYPFNNIWIYPETEQIYFPVEQIITGTWQGSSQSLNSRSDGLYERCDGTIANPCSANYTFNLSAYGLISNITNINVYFSGQSDTSGRTLTESYWNGTGFVNLANTLAWSATGGALPTTYDEFLSNSVPITAIINNTVKLKLTTPGSDRIFQNWLSLSLVSSIGTAQNLKGNSEMHITNIPNATWYQSIRTLTNYSEPSIAQAIWNYSVGRNLTYYYNATNDVWNNPTRNLTYYEDKTNYTRIQNDTWNYQGNVTTNLLTQITSGVWNYVARYVHGVLV